MKNAIIIQIIRKIKVIRLHFQKVQPNENQSSMRTLQLSKILRPLFSIIYFIAACARTEFPALSIGGAKAEIPKSPGRTPITPPLTPDFAGIPEVNNQLPLCS